MARPFRIGATGGSTCSRKSDQSPHLGDGTCRSQCATGGTRSTTPEGVSGLRVRPNPTSTPEAIGDQQSSGGPLEKYQCMWAGSGGPVSSDDYGVFEDALELRESLVGVGHLDG